MIRAFMVREVKELKNVRSGATIIFVGKDLITRNGKSIVGIKYTSDEVAFDTFSATLNPHEIQKKFNIEIFGFIAEENSWEDDRFILINGIGKEMEAEKLKKLRDEWETK